MSSHTTLVNIDADTAIKVATFISQQISDGAQAKAYLTECSSLIDSAQTQPLIAKLLEQKDNILAMENESDIEGCFQAIISVMFLLGDGTDSLPLVEQIAAALTSDNTTKTALRLKAYAMATNQLAIAKVYQTKVEEWAASWELKETEKRALFYLVSSALQQAGEQSQALRFLVLYLTTFNKDAALPADVQQEATLAVVAAIKSPVPDFSDRATLLESFSQQQTVGELGLLVQLLRIVCSGSLGDYAAFESANASLMTKHSVSSDEVRRTIRLLTLCSLGVETPSLSYSSVAAALSVPEDDVEIWVVDAIALGLLEASMDQFNQVVTVSRCVHRSFGPAQWQGVQTKLAALRARVASTLEGLRRHAPTKAAQA